MADKDTSAQAPQLPDMPRLKRQYRETIRPALQKEFSYDNVMRIPGLVKIVVNMVLTTKENRIEQNRMEAN